MWTYLLLKLTCVYAKFFLRSCWQKKKKKILYHIFSFLPFSLYTLSRVLCLVIISATVTLWLVMWLIFFFQSFVFHVNSTVWYGPVTVCSLREFFFMHLIVLCVHFSGDTATNHYVASATWVWHVLNDIHLHDICFVHSYVWLSVCLS